MLDGILLEQAGVPAAVVLTEPFARSGRGMAAIHGCPDFPFVLIPHPIATQGEATLRAWAEAALPGVVGILLGR